MELCENGEENYDKRDFSTFQAQWRGRLTQAPWPEPLLGSCLTMQVKIKITFFASLVHPMELKCIEIHLPLFDSWGLSSFPS